ncbi:hypothetical protein EN829_054120 [Mesorhizobium sp. M00.F.Ca.ET.186.01.1.1]|nr:hypothetical protein EN829_054120 [Mesorhizobium sp. M00.F.Ca.ET.186.01.1.1]
MGHPIIENGELTGLIGVNGSEAAYRGKGVKMTFPIENVQPKITPKVVESFSDLNSFDTKFELTGDFFGAKMEYKAIAGGFIMKTRIQVQ